MSLSNGDITDDIRRLLVAGLEEASGAYRVEFSNFADEVAPIIGEIAIRASMGSESAIIALGMIKQQILTRTMIATLEASGVAEDKLSLILGMVTRVVIGAL